MEYNNYTGDPLMQVIQTDDDTTKDMNENDKLKAGCFRAIIILMAFIIAMIVCSFFTSCKSVEYVPIIEHHTDTLIKTNVQHDSIYINDSTVITEKGDTVKIEKWHTKYVEKQVHDTTYVSKTDSIPQPYPVEVKVEKQLTWWQSFRMSLGSILLWVIGIIAAVYLVKYLLKKYMP